MFPAQVSRTCQEKTDLKNYASPNASWCPDMLSLYHDFLEKTKADGWVKLLSFKSNRDHIQGFKMPSGLQVTSGKAWPEKRPLSTHAPQPSGVSSANPCSVFRDSPEGNS